MWRLRLRSRITSSGFSKAAGSRLAPGKLSSTLSPGAISTPPNATGSMTLRPMVTGE